jgi:hypothetical protein
MSTPLLGIPVAANPPATGRRMRLGCSKRQAIARQFGESSPSGTCARFPGLPNGGKYR